MTDFTVPFDRRQTLALASLGGVATAWPASAQTVAERTAQPVPGQTAVMMSLTDRGSRAKWVTSVCTGSLALAAAELLMEYAPEPPFRHDTLQEAGPTHVAELTGRTPWMDGPVDAAVTPVAKRLGIMA